jgi:hypothetical protein
MKKNQRIGSAQKSRNPIFGLEAILMTLDELITALHDASLTRNRQSWPNAKSTITVRAEDFLLYYLARRFGT